MKTPLLVAVLSIASAAFAQETAAKEISVVATNEDLAWFARRIGGKDVKVEALSRGDQDPHRIPAKPSFLIKLSRGDVLIQTGLDQEHAWLPALLEASKNDGIKPGGKGFVNASAGLVPLEVPADLNRAAGVDFHPRGNPHYLIDPEGGRLAARNIAAGLERVRPEKAAIFRAGLAEFELELDQRMIRWAVLAAPLKGRSIVVRHGLWPYLGARYGFTVAADLEPKPGVEPSPVHVMKTIEVGRREKVVAVVVPQYAKEGLARRTADEIGCPLVVLPSGTTGRAPSEDWFAFVEHTIRSLADAARSTAGKAAPIVDAPASRR